MSGAAVGQWDVRIVCLECRRRRRWSVQDLMARGAMVRRDDRPPATVEEYCMVCDYVVSHFVDLELDGSGATGWRPIGWG